jgi:hypothetical protein
MPYRTLSQMELMLQLLVCNKVACRSRYGVDYCDTISFFRHYLYLISFWFLLLGSSDYGQPQLSGYYYC